MIEAVLGRTTAPNCVLLLGAHCDDIEIGCGGTLLQCAARWPNTRFIWVTFSSNAERAVETRAAAARLLAEVRVREIRVENFKEGYFPHTGATLKDYFEGLKREAPELILTHYRHDLHQDHRVINELTWNTFRDHLVFEYEIPKFDGDLGHPNMFLPLSREHMQRKTDILLECFPSQRARSWFTRDTFMALARLRGIESNAPDGFAEAFYARKLRLNI